MPAAKSRLGTFFKRGLRALLPTVLTLAVLVIVYNFFADNIVAPVNRGIQTILVRTGPGRAAIDGVFAIDVHDEKYRIPMGERGWKLGSENIDYKEVRADLDVVYPRIFGFFVALGLVFIAGFILATFVGRSVLSRFESGMGKFPVVKVIYPYARQVVEFFMRDKAVQFHSVVAVEYPRRGLYSIAFVTGLGMKTLSRAAKRDMINVFIPSSPTPITGYTLFVPVEEAIPIPISVDEAVRFAISGGVLVPESQRNSEEILERFRQIEAPTVREPSEETEEGEEGGVEKEEGVEEHVPPTGE
ncbi:MAG: DUF502 domain-containing protein [Planctomycetota bacterium]|jgi:uncharacterized membrane protein